ncbi:putative serine hydroxymethyltransferase, cytosolic-like [Apostichopus japonicus]|uniref:glycine hydroxymethyltransferase n=1 Tax=Stichopus japonicus TaxID=307972 RepID=A0A2G8JUF0_STIJA|nr:putative serine hydroxymethyltransferase, cytosolic-like [Apostichopus japonicus]
MGLDLPDGGHLTHGFRTNKKKISATSIFFESMPYKVDPVSGLIDYDKLAETARLLHPKLVIAGISCYSRNLDYKRFREIFDEHDAFLMADMAHVSGLVAADVVANPFEVCDIVTSTTHKSLRGPRAGMIFYRKGVRKVLKNGKEEMYELERAINDAVFPGLQGGPHMHAVAGLAVALKQALQPEFKDYGNKVIANARAMSKAFVDKGYSIATGQSAYNAGEKVLEAASIVCNKNTCPGDKSAFKPGGLRFGTPALTSRNLTESDFVKVVEFIHRALEITKELKALSGPTLKEFKAALKTNAEVQPKITALREEVENFAKQFPLPGLDTM